MNGNSQLLGFFAGVLTLGSSWVRFWDRSGANMGLAPHWARRDLILAPSIAMLWVPPCLGWGLGWSGRDVVRCCLSCAVCRLVHGLLCCLSFVVFRELSVVCCLSFVVCCLLFVSFSLCV